MYKAALVGAATIYRNEISIETDGTKTALALVCGVFCEFVTFPLVSWVRCGTWLYRFLIFAPLLTFMNEKMQIQMLKPKKKW